MFYEEDRFAPTNIEEDEFVNQPQRTKKVNKILAETSEDDPNLFRIKRKIDGLYKTITYYSSGQKGTLIRNAISGTTQKGHLVGTRNEELYFKTNIATGEVGKSANILFYDSPEQYEKHMMCEISQNIKDTWGKKNLISRKALLKEG